jgi:hypothetical protein
LDDDKEDVGRFWRLVLDVPSCTSTIVMIVDFGERSCFELSVLVNVKVDASSDGDELFPKSCNVVLLFRPDPVVADAVLLNKEEWLGKL